MACRARCKHGVGDFSPRCVQGSWQQHDTTSACTSGRHRGETRRQGVHQRAGGAAGEVARPDKAVFPAQGARRADWDLQTTEVLGCHHEVPGRSDPGRGLLWPTWLPSPTKNVEKVKPSLGVFCTMKLISVSKFCGRSEAAVSLSATLAKESFRVSTSAWLSGVGLVSMPSTNRRIAVRQQQKIQFGEVVVHWHDNVVHVQDEAIVSGTSSYRCLMPCQN